MPLSLLLFLPAVAFGQPFIGSEITSDPLPARNRLTPAVPAIAMARDDRGVVIAWTAQDASALNRLYVARLDAAGQVTGAVREIANFSNPVDVYAPSIARSATASGFLLGWVERVADPTSIANAVYCRLDDDLNAAPPAVLSAAGNGPVVVRSGKSDWIVANATVWRSSGGPFQGALPAIVASDMVVLSNDLPLMVGGQRRKITGATSSCRQDPGCIVDGDWGPICWCPIDLTTYTYSYALQAMWLYTTFVGRTFAIDSTAEPSVASDGKDAIIAMFDAAQGKSGAVIAMRLTLDAVPSLREIPLRDMDADAGQPGPDIATDGERYVVVWRTRTADGTHDVVGASIEADDKVTFLPIATSSADERDPSVIAVGDGEFLVAYEKLVGSERRLAGRFLDLENRRHSVR